jgi:uncharacterized membrane protein YkoI
MFTVLIGVLAAVPAFDASARAMANPLLLAQATPSVSADEAVALVRAQSGGRILNLRLESRAGPAVYRVKVLLEGGRVRVYRVDASSGKILQ